MKITGIYKITNPNGKVYIGQAKDIKNRWKEYLKLRCKRQIKLYNSFLKHGVENHLFEVIEECELSKLDCRERHWQDVYDAINKNNLNIILTPCGELKYQVSKETKEKLKLKATGRILDEETKNKIKSSVSRKNHYRAKKVIDLETGKIWNCAKDAADELNIKYTTLLSYLNKVHKSNYKLEYKEN